MTTLNKVIGQEGLLVDGDWIESKDQDANGNVRIIQLADIGDGHFLNKSNRFLTREKAIELKCTFLEPGDLLIARMPDPIGRTCIFPGLETPCVTVVDICILRSKNPNIYPEWIKFLVNSILFRNKINKYISGTTRKRISRGNLEKIEFSLPLIDNQIKISKILSWVEELTQDRKQSIVLLDDLLKSKFHEMFGDPIKNEKKWNQTTIEKLVKKEKNAIKRGPFGGALKKEIFVNSGYLVYEQYHALNNDFSFERYFINDEKYNELKDFRIVPDDIIISCSGVYLGKLAIIPADAKEGIINQALLKVSLNQSIYNNHFFCSLFTHPSFKNTFLKNRGSGIPNFPPMSEFKSFSFINPPITLQNQYANIVENIESLKKDYKQSLAELENLYGSLSQRAFEGELDLSRLDITEELQKMKGGNNVIVKEETPYAQKEYSKELQKVLDDIEEIQSIIDTITNVSKDPLMLFVPQDPEINNKLRIAVNIIIEKINNLPVEDYKDDPVIIEKIDTFVERFNQLVKTEQKKQEATADLTPVMQLNFNFERIADLLREHFTGYHFNFKMAYRLLERKIEELSGYYFSSEELFQKPALQMEYDLKDFFETALQEENPFIKLTQLFYNSEEENINLNITDEDYEYWGKSDKKNRSGIYFVIQ